MSIPPTAIDCPHLAKRMGSYSLLTETFSARIRLLPDGEARYKAAAAEWAAVCPSPLPPINELAERDIYLAKLDRFCNIGDMLTIQQLFFGFFAAFGALTILNDSYMVGLHEEDRANVSNAMNTYVLEQLNCVENLHPGRLFELGQMLRYRDSEGVVRDCTIKDYGTSGLSRKSWYIITHDGNDEKVAFEEELKDCILI